MVIYSFDTLKNSSKKKDTRARKEIVEVLQQASYRRNIRGKLKMKDQDDEIIGVNLAFVG